MHPPLTSLGPLQTARLTIRPLTADDSAALSSLTDDPAITQAVHFLPSPFTRADAERLIAGNDAGNCFLGAFRGSELIGVVGSHAHGSDRLEIGYWIGSRFQRQGFAAEAAGAVIAQLRRLYPERQIVAECRPANEGSWNLLHKLGFRPTGEQGDRPGRALLTLPVAPS